MRTEEEYIEDIIKNHDLEDYRERNIISIDPASSRDFDDAFDIEVLGNNRYRIGIYISNVSFRWMYALDLWDSFLAEYLLFIYQIENVLCYQQYYQMPYVVLQNMICVLLSMFEYY